jgi:hypothetical protein
MHQSQRPSAITLSFFMGRGDALLRLAAFHSLAKESTAVPGNQRSISDARAMG